MVSDESGKEYSVLEYESSSLKFYHDKMSRFTGTTEQLRLRSLLREIRVQAGLKQAELADRLKQSQSFVSKYESGERRLDLLELRDICAAAGLSLAEFVQRFEQSSLNETRLKVPKSAKAFLGKRTKH